MKQRLTASFYAVNNNVLKMQMLNWANRFSICCFMDSHNYRDKFSKYDCLVAADSCKSFSPHENIFQKLDEFYANDDWIFGHLGYDLKNEIEELQSNHINKVNFPDIFFFVPAIVLSLKNNLLTIYSIEKNPQLIFDEIQSATDFKDIMTSQKEIDLKAAMNQNEYTKQIKKIKEHIVRGDCYELNYCQEFFSEDALIEPALTYKKLLEISPTPFSCFYKLQNKYVLCASPERFLLKNNRKIFSQPIKGTAPRNADAYLDKHEKNNLQKNQKEKSENVMIVDLVRNDFGKICNKGTVKVDELFGIYSFPQVHQMISTISGELKEKISISEILKATFPMGSMTGAPKIKAMQLIERYEKTKRQLFSGSIGYITPQKDFDFNVVIRSIFYNATNKFLNYLVGSAITFYADAEKEYDECILKAKAILETLNGNR